MKFEVSGFGILTPRLKIAHKPYIVWSLGPTALKYQSIEGKGRALELILYGSKELYFKAFGPKDHTI